MKRRLALQRVALMVGGAVTAPSLAAILNSCKSPSDSAASGFSLDTDQRSLLAEIAEVIIPKTDTPGAKDTGTPEVIEILLKDCYSEEQQKHFVAGLKDLEAESKKLGGSFVSLDEANKLAVVHTMRDKARAEKEDAEKVKIVDAETGKEKEDVTKKEPLIPFFTLVRDLTIFGYYSSEYGVTKAFDYSPVPGRFDPCMKVTPDQRAYS
ncbi:gluconate 2-dehydrogenase subunit 3 family protein [Leadbetterella sp. DM7]|uniref:gluconate 2-dehydrogenase subunit 3 family protein n=1 Tax=Leadbetterella sp. DM7 TaxID=3235085 RepID=UPI00349EC3EB